MLIRPKVEPISVIVPVTCVVRIMAPKWEVHMAFCKPHAAATRQTGSNLPGMKAADTSRLEFSTRANP